MRSMIFGASGMFQHAWVRLMLAAMVSLALVLSLTQSSLAQQAVPLLDPSQKKTVGLDVFDTPGTIALGQADLRVTAARIINAALSLLGIIAVVVILVGGFLWMTAGGNDDQVTKAKAWIFSGIIGLAIILSAFAISKFVLEQLGKATEVVGTP